MGNASTCFFPKGSASPTSESRPSVGSRRAKKKERVDDQALAAAVLFQHYQNTGSIPFNRSTSVVYPSPALKKQSLGKSSSSRQRSRSDFFVQSHQLDQVNEDSNVDAGLETKHFVLVHGGGFGAWCWYKTIALLEEGGFEVDAVDLTGSGIDSFDTNNISSMAQYIKPLTDLFNKLADGKKVILVGHDFGGACISYVMELFPSKIAKAVFIAAAMLTNGQSTFDLFAQQTGSVDLMRQAQVFSYANGKNQLPTAIDIDRSLLRDLLFNQCPPKDVALASVSMRPIPFAPAMEKLSLSDTNYGSVRRFYIKTVEDFAMPVLLQDAMINANPPEEVFQIKNSDHSPFFSKPRALNRLLLEISRIPSKKSDPSH